MNRIAAVDRASYPGLNAPLNWHGLAFVLVAHVAVVIALLNVRSTVDKVSVKAPIFAEIIISERGEPAAVDPEPPTPAVEPPPPTVEPPTPRPIPQAPDPKPLLAVPETAPAPAERPVAQVAIEPTSEPAAAVADAAATQAASPPARASLESLPGSPDDVRKYIAAVMRQLHRHKTYPRELKKAKIEGTVVVQFTIDRDGHLVASDVTQSSGHPGLDRAAMEMLARADPLPSIPDFMDRDELALAIPVEYSLITDR